jgi:hypothetical protein
MRKFINGLFDNLGVLLAAVLTLCGFLLLFMPWKQALSIKIVDPPPKPSGEVFVNVSPEKKADPQHPH